MGATAGLEEAEAEVRGIPTILMELEELQPSKSVLDNIKMWVKAIPVEMAGPTNGQAGAAVELADQE